jgi:hypothetical protein
MKAAKGLKPFSMGSYRMQAQGLHPIVFFHPDASPLIVVKVITRI